MKVRSPAGQKYTVRRRWLPWRRRCRFDWMDRFPSLGDDPISAIIGVIMLIPAAIFLVVVLAELLLLLLLLPIVLLTRALFGDPWTIEVKRAGEAVYTERVKGWSDSGHRIEHLAKLIDSGQLPPGVYEAPNMRPVGWYPGFEHETDQSPPHHS